MTTKTIQLARAYADKEELAQTVTAWRMGISPVVVKRSDVTVNWNFGSKVAGYDEVSKRVSGIVANMLPELIDQAIKQVRGDADAAYTALQAEIDYFRTDNK